ncbi:MAG: type VI secretion system-associated FHA domain protein TagH [Candidatus Competibacteraceae bacterium]
MPLKLTITSFQRLSPGQETTKILDRGSLSIGRAAQNGWILQDPERILSSSHCVVHHQDDGYFLTDTSTNGTFLNDSEQRIPRNQTIPLKDGDHFILGEYEIEASLIPGAADLVETEPVGPITDVVLAPRGLPAVGVASLGGGPSAPGQPSFADLLAEEPDHLNLAPPSGPAPKGAVATEPPPDLLTPDRAFFEPPELAAGASPPLPTPPVPEPALAETLPPAAPSSAETESPRPTAPEAPLIPAAESGEMLIPDDWWLAPQAAPVAPRPTGEIVPPPPAPAEPVRAGAPPLEPPRPQPPVRAETPPLEPPRPQPPTPVAVQPPRPPTPAPVEPAGLDAETLIQAFLKGAGLPRARPPAERWLEIATNLGAIFRETVQGLTDILLARGDVKGEFRLDRTNIRATENNPLKTPPGQPPLNPEEIMTLLLVRQKDAYMSPVQAVREGFKDIKDHQVAVWAGVQTALNRLLERFDPNNLETRLQQTVLDSILPASRKAKYWDLFTSEYETIAREAEDDFNELFGREFARAYEERLRARR